ncbi:cyclin [Phycomyces blakesleeanus NRRL 1555(-)]|uniref:Cyclin n=2 Tax=Phycomyces blakesleeanus TaxID=4837 RepID=A0A162XP29_PHYB8|nr:cyclin [Phycomyces blakesleeanus NRRL 1555(-)]OAD75915.1 cyclin [Phycomyces blakesleeanus NRRL 1555(-)]|eukprot:XP_018293955.1 cyclin [Phycomyces blakesleeanus NRRL 1555(-)]
MPHYHLDIAEFPVPLLLKIVANLINSIISTNDRILTSENITHFHSRAVPNIAVQAYMSRILKFAPFPNEVLLSILVYFDRIAKLKKNRIAISSLNIHRLLISSIVVASKLTSDVFYSNTRYAKVGGLSLLELNQLELEFLFLCNFDLHVRLQDMQVYGDQLLTHAMSQQQTLVELTNLNIFPPPLRILTVCDTGAEEEAEEEDDEEREEDQVLKSPSEISPDNDADQVLPITPPYPVAVDSSKSTEKDSLSRRSASPNSPTSRQRSIKPEKTSHLRYSPYSLSVSSKAKRLASSPYKG